MNILVLGAGLIGGPIAMDLAQDDRFTVTSCDRSGEALAGLAARNDRLLTRRADLSDPSAVTALCADYDLIINAVPGFMGFATAQAIIAAGKNCVDIAFYEEDPFLLDEPARAAGVTMVMDCGLYPGMGSVLIMAAAQQLDRVDSIMTLVGGLPQVRRWPSEYKAVFSPVDVIEEYTRPARYIENGVEVVRPALSDPEFVFFEGLGTLEAFNTDGLRTLARTIQAPNMKEKTLRYPGHIAKMAVLRELGFFDREKTLDVGGQKVSPLEITGQILFDDWKLEPGEGDITVFRSTITGLKDGLPVRTVIDLMDRYDPATDTTSMARTTGFTAALTARLLAEGLYDHKGISPPEYLGKHPACVDFLQQGLQKRGVNWIVRQES